MATERLREELLELFKTGLVEVEGRSAVCRYLASDPSAFRIGLVAIGKAAQSMAIGAYDALGDKIGRALVVSKTGHLDFALLEERHMQGIESAHPLPDGRSLRAGDKLIRFLLDLPADWPLLFLISGGASSLVDVLPDGIGLRQLQETNRWLLASGLTIAEMNLVRKSLSLIKAGGLLNWVSERDVRVLFISDVRGDDPAVIGSGLLVPDPLLAEGVAALSLPQWLRGWVAQGIESRRKPSRSVSPELHIVARLDDAIKGVVRHGVELGYRVYEDYGFQAGDAADKGREFAKTLQSSPPGLYIWGGETTVCLPQSPGSGGRNQHLALAVAIEIADRHNLYFLAAGSDGTDGPTEHAGALVDGGTVGRGAAQGLDVSRCLEKADSGRFLAASGDLINTGPTGTNVMDLMLGLNLEED